MLYKMMGYGLTDIQTDDRGRITDPRINPASILLDYDREEEATVRNYVASTLDDKESLERVLGGWSYGHLDPESTDPFECVDHLNETGLEGTLIMRPVGYTDWSRRGNLLDSYIDHANGYSGDHLEMLSGGIHPYANNFMDTSTFQKLDWYTIGDWIRAVNGKKETNELERIAYKTATDLGFGDIGHEALLKRIAPMPPESIINLAEFGQLFTTPDVVFSLRPMIVTFGR